MDLIHADKNRKEIQALLGADIDIDLNDLKDFRISIPRDAWEPVFEYGGFIYEPNSEVGGCIGRIFTDTSMNVIKVCGYTWRGMLNNKAIVPPSGQTHKRMSGDLNRILRDLIEPVFDGVFVVSSALTGVTLTNYQFDRYVTLLSGINKMLKSVSYKLHIKYQQGDREPGYVFIEAVPVVDYSGQIELSQDSRLDFVMTDIKDGYNHMIVCGKGELEMRNVIHLYAWPDGSIKKTKYYTGINEREYIYENTSTETDEVESKAREAFAKVMNHQEFKMSAETLELDVQIGDIVGGRDYLTGIYAAKPIANIILTTDEESGLIEREYQLEGEGD